MSWVVHIVMTLVSAAWLYGGPVGERLTAGASPEARPPLVVVRALGPVPSEQLRAACRELLAAYSVRCVVRASRSVTDVMAGWDADREQLDARQTLELLFESRSRDAVVELDITALDLYEPGKPYVFGLASLPDRTAILSLSRLSDDGSALARTRMTTLVKHEFGHAVGLAHHDVEGCVMRQDPTVASLDRAPEGPCSRCHKRLREQIERLGRPGQTTLDRARGLLVRGRQEQARQELVDALWTYRLDAELLDAFARLFFEAGQYNEAISLLRHAVKQEPQRAAVYVQLGLAYQHRGRDGDLARAVGHFEHAVRLRPDWDSVVDHLELTRGQLSAQGPR